MNLNELEEAYLEFSQNLPRHLPDGILTVNLALLEELNLLHYADLEIEVEPVFESFPRIETAEKLTLFNDRFAIWIVPNPHESPLEEGLTEEQATTLTYIALLHPNAFGLHPHLEIVFSASGVYNTTKYIMKVLHRFLHEVLDTEILISSINKEE